MENVWGTWAFFYLPAFLCGCGAGGAVMLALAKKIIAKQARQIAQLKQVHEPEISATGSLLLGGTPGKATLRRAS